MLTASEIHIQQNDQDVMKSQTEIHVINVSVLEVKKKEVLKVVRKLESGKAAGIDGI